MGKKRKTPPVVYASRAHVEMRRDVERLVLEVVPSRPLHEQAGAIAATVKGSYHPYPRFASPPENARHLLWAYVQVVGTWRAKARAAGLVGPAGEDTGRKKKQKRSSGTLDGMVLDNEVLVSALWDGEVFGRVCRWMVCLVQSMAERFRLDGTKPGDADAICGATWSCAREYCDMDVPIVMKLSSELELILNGGHEAHVLEEGEGTGNREAARGTVVGWKRQLDECLSFLCTEQHYNLDLVKLWTSGDDDDDDDGMDVEDNKEKEADSGDFYFFPYGADYEMASGARLWHAQQNRNFTALVLWGRTRQGQSIRAEVYNQNPVFYLEVPPNYRTPDGQVDREIVERFLACLDEGLDNQIEKERKKRKRRSGEVDHDALREQRPDFVAAMQNMDLGANQGGGGAGGGVTYESFYRGADDEVVDDGDADAEMSEGVPVNDEREMRRMIEQMRTLSMEGVDRVAEERAMMEAVHDSNPAANRARHRLVSANSGFPDYDKDIGLRSWQWYEIIEANTPMDCQWTWISGWKVVEGKSNMGWQPETTQFLEISLVYPRLFPMVRDLMSFPRGHAYRYRNMRKHVAVGTGKVSWVPVVGGAVKEGWDVEPWIDDPALLPPTYFKTYETNIEYNVAAMLKSGKLPCGWKKLPDARRSEWRVKSGRQGHYLNWCRADMVVEIDGSDVMDNVNEEGQRLNRRAEIVDEDEPKLDESLHFKSVELVFDIECLTDGTRFPDHNRDPVTTISLLINDHIRNKKTEIVLQWKNVLPLTLRKPSGRDFHCMFFKTERGLLLAFTKIVNLVDPDVIYGHNSLSFDGQYMKCRAKMLGIEDMYGDFSRQCGAKPKYQGKKHKGKDKFQITVRGRCMLDFLYFCWDSFKLSKEPSHQLNHLSIKYCSTPKVALAYSMILELMATARGRLILTIYAKGDVWQTHLLGDKFKFVVVWMQMAYIANVYLQQQVYRGVQYKVYAAFLNRCRTPDAAERSWSLYAPTPHHNGTIRFDDRRPPFHEVLDGEGPSRDELKMKDDPNYHGAYVREPFRGAYWHCTLDKLERNSYRSVSTNATERAKRRKRMRRANEVRQGNVQVVEVLDFSSEYPTIIMDKNLCTTTSVSDEQIAQYKLVEGRDYYRVPNFHETETDIVEVPNPEGRAYLTKKFLVGVLPEAEREWKRFRSTLKDIKKANNNKARELMKVNGWDKNHPQVAPLLFAAQLADSRQNGVKILMNSGYGFFANMQSTFKDFDLATYEAVRELEFSRVKAIGTVITLYGQYFIKKVAHHVRNKFRKGAVITTKAGEKVTCPFNIEMVYGDTDSIMPGLYDWDWVDAELRLLEQCREDMGRIRPGWEPPQDIGNDVDEWRPTEEEKKNGQWSDADVETWNGLARAFIKRYKALLDEYWRWGAEMGHSCTELLGGDWDMEMESILLNMIMILKKMYAALKYEYNKKKDLYEGEDYVKGMMIKKRGPALMAKKGGKRILLAMCRESNLNKAKLHYNDLVTALYNDEIPLDDLVLSKNLNKDPDVSFREKVDRMRKEAATSKSRWVYRMFGMRDSEPWQRIPDHTHPKWETMVSMGPAVTIARRLNKLGTQERIGMGSQVKFVYCHVPGLTGKTRVLYGPNRYKVRRTISKSTYAFSVAEYKAKGLAIYHELYHEKLDGVVMPVLTTALLPPEFGDDHKSMGLAAFVQEVAQRKRIEGWDYDDEDEWMEQMIEEGVTDVKETDVSPKAFIEAMESVAARGEKSAGERKEKAVGRIKKERMAQVRKLCKGMVEEGVKAKRKAATPKKKLGILAFLKPVDIDGDAIVGTCKMCHVTLRMKRDDMSESESESESEGEGEKKKKKTEQEKERARKKKKRREWNVENENATLCRHCQPKREGLVREARGHYEAWKAKSDACWAKCYKCIDPEIYNEPKDCHAESCPNHGERDYTTEQKEKYFKRLSDLSW